MADWYVSSAKFATVSAWAATHAYNVGDFVKATAPASQKEYVFRCTTAGTSAGTEPTWSTAYTDSSTKTDGGVTWTNVTGQSAYGWSAAAGTLACIDNTNSCRPLAGDRVFISSDHSESFSSINKTYGFNNGSSAFGLISILSVNRAGSVPPVAADLTNGAAITLTPNASQSLLLEAACSTYWQGITFTLAGANPGFLVFNSGYQKAHYLKNCAIVLNSNSGSKVYAGTIAKATWDSTTIQFGNASQAISLAGYSLDLTWINTASAIAGATIPTALLSAGNTAGAILAVTCRGVDLSAITGTLVFSSSAAAAKVLFDSCKIASAVTRYNASTSSTAPEEVELVNCYDGTNVLNERYTPAGTVTTDRSTYLSSGAQDDIGNYSLKMASSVRSDFQTMALDCFAFDVENTVTGSSKTATVEIVSSASLNNTDIRLVLEYMGTSGNPSASFGDSLATVLTAASALPSSSNTWTNPPGTPQKQLLQVTFTPQRAGRVRGLVRLGKVSTTVWVNPQVTIS